MILDSDVKVEYIECDGYFMCNITHIPTNITASRNGSHKLEARVRCMEELEYRVLKTTEVGMW